jgi:hypothetical protein
MAEALASLTVRCGPAARARILRDGLTPDTLAGIVGAAGGPKGLGLAPLDRWLFGEWLPGRRTATPLPLIGSSVGAVRMVAGVQADPLAAIERFVEGYIGQDFPAKPTPAEVTAVFRDTLRSVIGEAAAAICGQSRFALCLLASRVMPAAGREPSKLTYALAAAANLVGRPQLARWFRRTAFESRPVLPKIADAFGLERVPLTPAILETATLASGTLPSIMTPVADVPGAAPGSFVDGGIVDYHPVLPLADWPGVILYPHFRADLLPGWFDKWPGHRARDPARHAGLENVLLIAPSPALLARLPNRKLPDRQDFYAYGEDHDRRRRDWRTAVSECAAMAEDFARLTADPGRWLPVAEAR